MEGTRPSTAGGGCVSLSPCDLTPESGSPVGAGEDLVQNFVQLHMTSILQPFAEHARDLQAQVQQLADQLSETREGCEVHKSRLDVHEEQLSSLSARAAETGERLEKAHVELASQKKERARLEGNHEMTKATLGKAKDMIRDLTTSVEALRPPLEETKGNITALERGLADAEERITNNFESRLNKQGRVCKELNEKQSEMQKLCQEAKKLGEVANAAVKRLADGCEQRGHGDAVSLEDLRRQTASLEERLCTVDQFLQKQGNTLEEVDREVQHLRTWTPKVACVEELHQKQADVAACIEGQALRLGRVESSLAEFQIECCDERTKQASELDDLEQRIVKNLAEITHWKDTQKAQVDVITSAGRRLDELEGAQGTLQARTKALEESTSLLAPWQQGVAKALEVHDVTLKDVTANLAHTHKQIEGASAGLCSLRSEIGVDRDQLQKIGARLDLCCSYFNGLGKGLQDTHRQICSGESGLLPPKQLPPKQPGGVAALPALPRTPRSSSTMCAAAERPRTSASPRRPEGLVT